MADPLLLAIDQGTTSSRAMVFTTAGTVVASAQQEFPQLYPREGWVEHDPAAILDTVIAVTRQALEQSESHGTVAAIGITNQRETTLVWDRETGTPVHNAIVWQDRRTAGACEKLRKDGAERMVRQKTGLLLDPYFSATKIGWILDHVDGARADAEAGRLAFGTVDCWLLWHLTGGRVHATDATNACRTSLYNLESGDWDAELCALFGVPGSMLPEVRDSAAEFGETDPALFGRAIPVRGIAGDQQAATIGQMCFAPGDIKSTYGTGCFIVMNTGAEIIRSQNKLLSTVAWQLDGKRTYALEGAIFVAGAAVQWLRDELGIIDSAAETEALARSVEDTGGVYLVPAFTGLGAPHWQAEARGTLTGLTRGSGRAQIARAALESVAYQTADLIDAFRHDGIAPKALRVDGGMVANDWLCQFLADTVGVGVARPQVMETTALGAAALAGLQSGLFGSMQAMTAMWQEDRRFQPAMAAERRKTLLDGWHRAIRQTLAP